MEVEVFIPLSINLVVSEANRANEHWASKKERHDIQKFIINSAYNTKIHGKYTLPCQITLTRIAPRKLDKEDNLPIAFKWIKDYLAGHMIEGNKSGGMKDGDSRLEWFYAQEKGKPKQYAIKIQIKSS